MREKREREESATQKENGMGPKFVGMAVIQWRNSRGKQWQNARPSIKAQNGVPQTAEDEKTTQ